MLQWMTNRKSHMSYGMALLSMTLTDIECHFNSYSSMNVTRITYDGKVSMVFNRSCFPKVRLFKVTRPTGNHIHRKSGARQTHCYYTPLIGSIILPIYSCHFQWPSMTLKVTRIMQSLSNAIRRTFVRHLARFNWRGASRGPSAIAKLLVLID